MKTSFSNVVRLLDENLGRCPRCMKIAFLCACASWLGVIATQVFLSAGLLAQLAFFAALAFSALWLTHLTVYTGRVMAALWAEYVSAPSLAPASAARNGMSRRNMLWVCGTALSIGVSAAVWLPAPARAAGHACGKGVCPDDAPNCCSRAQGKCCNGNWACVKTATCHDQHADARAKCGRDGIVWACT